MADKNKERFLELWNRVSIEDEKWGRDIYRRLRSQYIEPHRAYHNLRHIKGCLDEFEEVKSFLNDPDEVEMAIWFHDAIYDPCLKDNEEMTAKLAGMLLGFAWLPGAFIERVVELILATKHDIPPKDLDARILVDIDIASLGHSWKVFNRNTAKILEEYRKAVPDDGVFFKGRADFFKQFLKSHPDIYLTSHFQKKYGAQAMKNIEKFIAKYAE